MKLSTKGRYGLRGMVELATRPQGETLTLAAIAKNQNISENYLEQVFSALRKAGLVRSVKGAQGGYALGSDPARITAGKVLRALEGDLSIADEGPEAGDALARSIRACIRKNVWNEIDARVNALLDAVTLEELAKECTRGGPGGSMYHI